MHLITADILWSQSLATELNISVLWLWRSMSCFFWRGARMIKSYSADSAQATAKLARESLSLALSDLSLIHILQAWSRREIPDGGCGFWQKTYLSGGGCGWQNLDNVCKTRCKAGGSPWERDVYKRQVQCALLTDISSSALFRAETGFLKNRRLSYQNIIINLEERWNRKIA